MSNVLHNLWCNHGEVVDTIEMDDGVFAGEGK